MRTTMNAQKQFDFVSKVAKLKEDEVVLKQKINLVSDSLSSNSKDIEFLYLPARKNFHE